MIISHPRFAQAVRLLWHSCSSLGSRFLPLRDQVNTVAKSALALSITLSRANAAPAFGQTGDAGLIAIGTFADGVLDLASEMYDATEGRREAERTGRSARSEDPRRVERLAACTAPKEISPLSVGPVT